MFESLPNAIAFSTMIVTGGGIAITGICKMKPPKSNGFMLKSLCDEKSGNILASVARLEKTQADAFKEMKRTQDKIFDKIDKLK